MTKHRYLALKFQKVISSTLYNIFFNNFIFYKFFSFFLSFFLSLLIFNFMFLFLPFFFSIFIMLSRNFTNTVSPFQMLSDQIKGVLSSKGGEFKVSLDFTLIIVYVYCAIFFHCFCEKLYLFFLFHMLKLY